ncbi:MAG: CHAT domain-containing protein [Candidatus Electronema aureum]|uniref:CHAT domain-containing protein n=1 Tax=Candidatus Electronema aureum TaxID=2005002 RepID=A0A521G0R8_9BACT|nr:MAG: CHAT domain-containing protein [Candidatus Electronema aureum]
MKRIARITLIVALLIGGMVRPVWCQENVDKYVQELNKKTAKAFKTGDSQQGAIIAEHAYRYALEYLGPEHPDTLTSINNLATFYTLQGHYSNAEPLLKQALRLREKVLGRKHPATLTSINNLATLYKSQGRYNEAELLYKQVLQLSEKILGMEHPDTIVYMTGLPVLYQLQGRYSEAEPLCKQTLQLSEKVLGKEHPYTILSISNLGQLYQSQSRYSEAEPLLKQALRLREKVLGRKHPDTLISINNLAVFYQLQGHHSEAEPFLKQALQGGEELLGKEHPDTIKYVNNLAALYESQGRYNEVEPLLKEATQLSEKVLGKEHPDTLTYLNNLAALYGSQGRYNESEPLRKKALQLSEKVLGRIHPHTLLYRENYIWLLVNTDRPHLALRLLQEQEKLLLSRSFQEIYTSSSEKVRRLYLQSISRLQHITLSLAQQQSKEEYQRYAAEIILRWKQLYAEESSIQHRLLNLSNDSEAEKLRTERTAAQAKVSQALRQQNIAELIEKANQDETALLALARHLKTSLEVKDVTLDKVLSALPQDSGLIEYRLFYPIDFKTGKAEKRHLGALLLLANAKAKQRFLFHDLGTLAEIAKNREKTAGIYNRLLGPFDEQIKGLKQLYIAPDGHLNLLPFVPMRLPDGRFLAERQQINQLQTGRDLIENSKDFPRGKGLVAIGGAKYVRDSMPAGKTEPAQTLVAYQQRAVRELAEGIQYLKESRKEAEEIFKKHGSNPEDLLLIGDDASEYSLKHLKQPPRILHLSTHGFYLGDDKKEDGLTEQLRDEAPLLLSGLALAGANNWLQGRVVDSHGDDGLLYSLEVLGLNLHGTELVSLSACDTGKGVVDYSEGVYGLVRAFRTAGAKNVLMTLTPVGDKSSRDFMETFYDNWLSSKKNISPAEALHETRLQFIHDKKPVQDWAPFVLVGK